MSEGSRGFSKVGGVFFSAAGGLFLAKAVLELMAGPPPGNGADLLAWTASRGFLLAATIETLFLAVTFLIPGILALYESLAGTSRTSAAIGCGIMAVTIPFQFVLLDLYGRIVFPVYGLRIRTPDIAELVFGLYYGGLHAVAELQAVATFVLSLARRRGAYGRTLAALGFATSAAEIIGAYPWVIGPRLWFVSSLFFPAWLAVVGMTLYRPPATPHIREDGPGESGPA